MRPASLVSACLSCSCSLAISSRSLMTGFFTCRFPLDRKCPEGRHDLPRMQASAHPIKSDRSAAPTSFAIIPAFRRNGSKGAVIRCEATLRAPPEGKDQFGGTSTSDTRKLPCLGHHPLHAPAHQPRFRPERGRGGCLSALRPNGTRGRRPSDRLLAQAGHDP